MFIRNCRITLILFFFLFICAEVPSFGKVIYVDTRAPGLNNGSSWVNGYNYLQDALADANSSEKPIEIRVAQGIYRPDEGRNQTSGNRKATFRLTGGVTLKGGYAGHSEPLPGARDIRAYQTILSGDLKNNDGPNFTNIVDNSYHVLACCGTGPMCALDGFTITAGNADNGDEYPYYAGGGMWNESAEPNVSKCTFIGNHAIFGAGMYNYKSNPTVTNCRFERNAASMGGGIRNNSSHANIILCSFDNNKATNYYGGGISNYSSNPIIKDCIFNSNNGFWYGGGIFNHLGDPHIIGCEFNHNEALMGGGVYNYESNPTLAVCEFKVNRASSDSGGIGNYLSNASIIDCSFIGNETADYGGGIFAHSSNLEIVNCSFAENIAYRAGGGVCNYKSSSTIEDCTFDLNGCQYSPEDDYVVLYGGGILNQWSDVRVVNCSFNENWALDGGGVGSYESSYILTGCTFIGNSAYSGGGAVDSWSSSISVVTNCSFFGNWSYHENGKGGGMRTSDDKSTLTNCIFSGNRADYGAGIHASGNLILTNCTFSGNSAESQYGGIGSDGGSRTLRNCIFWANKDKGGTTLSSQFDWQSAVVENSCIQGWTSSAGGRGNTGANPLLADADGPDDRIGTPDDELRLSPGSPCIDSGSNTAAADGQPLIGVDIDLNVRRVDDLATADRGSGKAPIVDMGAYEFGSGPISPVLYVDSKAQGVGTGVRWLDAFVDLQTALQTASVARARVDKIVVAAGPYRPGISDGNRETTFSLVSGMAIYGGFAGSEDLSTFSLDDRDFETNETFLSGDLENDDILGSKDDNCYHVVTGKNVQAAVLDGFTVTAGNANAEESDDPNNPNRFGGGIYLSNSDITMRNCVLTDNDALQGSCIYSDDSCITLSKSTIGGNSGDPNVADVWMQSGRAEILDYVNFNCGFWNSDNGRLTGPGQLQIKPSATLYCADTIVDCDVVCLGNILVPHNKELIVEGTAVIDLGDPNNPNDFDPEGTIQCDGLLHMRDYAELRRAYINVNRVNLKDHVEVKGSIIEALKDAPSGQFYIDGNVKITGNIITADGDRYMDLDPSVFQGIVENNWIHIRITEGVGLEQGGLLELRGKDGMIATSCETIDRYNNPFFLEISKECDIPVFDFESWTIDELNLAPGAKVNLTNRFDFFNGDANEVIYVNKLILGAESVLNTAYNYLYYKELEVDPTAKITNVPLLGFSVNNIEFDDANEFLVRVKHNNFKHPKNRDYDRIHVERIDGTQFGRKAVMRLCNIRDKDLDSPLYNTLIKARAKGHFDKSSEDEIHVRFEYLFCDPNGEGELVIYLSETLDMSDQAEQQRTEVARLRHPPQNRPGSASSGAWGVFDKLVPRGNLNFLKGTIIEFELIGPEGTCLLIDNWDPFICKYCGDITGDKGVTIADFMMVIKEYGSKITDNRCAFDKLVFCGDGYDEVTDVMIWDWGNLLKDRDIMNFCPDTFWRTLPAPNASVTQAPTGESASALLSEFIDSNQPLLIAGKRYKPNDFLTDRLYGFDQEYKFIGLPFEMKDDRLNGRLVRDNKRHEVYQLNLEKGLVKLPTQDEVIGPGGYSYPEEPRYHKPATVYVGLQGENVNWSGWPMFDAAVKGDYVYVVPVLIDPEGDTNEPYTAAAKLQLLDGANSSYRVVQVYDDPDANDPSDNRELNSLHEIEVDDNGNIYVINSCRYNWSDILWKYNPQGQMVERLVLSDPNNQKLFLSAPIGLHVSSGTSTLYLASSLSAPDATSTTIYGLSTETLDLTRSVTINGMGHVTSITEDPKTFTLWVVGFTIEKVPEYVELQEKPFYKPYIAKIPYEPGNGPGEESLVEQIVYANCLSNYDNSDPSYDPNFDLALPLSILWTGPIDGDLVTAEQQ